MWNLLDFIRRLGHGHSVNGRLAFADSARSKRHISAAFPFLLIVKELERVKLTEL
jgi:hypothetical protein